MVLNAAVQMLREAEELKEKISKFKGGTSMLSDHNLWALQEQLQKIYQKVLILDLEYALDKKVEQDLWNVGFKQQIDALQSISKDRKNPLRSDGQAMLSWVLQAAAGFYLCLLHQICTTFKLDLPFRRRASLLGWVEGWGSSGADWGSEEQGEAARYVTQHCLVHLGDLARYRQQLPAAHAFYKQAVGVNPHSGQPYNQLALVWGRRARRLHAVYWHVRSLLVRAPFPPARDNLRTALAHAQGGSDPLPVVPGLAAAVTSPGAVTSPRRRLDAHAHVQLLLRVAHLIYNMEDLEESEELVNTLNSSLTALVATDSFEPMTLIKMSVVIMWLVDWSTEQLTVDASEQTEAEARAANQSLGLAAGFMLALLLPAYTLEQLPVKALPALVVWVSWAASQPAALARSAVRARRALPAALAHALGRVRAEPAEPALPACDQLSDYDSLPLSEDLELYGFLPLETAHARLQFRDSAPHSHSHSVPDVLADTVRSPLEVSPASLENDKALESRVRARRLVELGKRLAELCPEFITYTIEDGRAVFTAAHGHADLEACSLSLSHAPPPPEGEGEGLSDSEGEGPPPPPRVISEADFKEKVREKRAGILKPQGSLERAREERALAGGGASVDEPECSSGSDGGGGEVGETTREGEGERGEGGRDVTRKARMNVAMAAIMRKQEENNKQVKFLSPPPTPDSVSHTSGSATPTMSLPKEDQPRVILSKEDKPKVSQAKDEKPRVIQPKPIKSLANLPIGKKTGGILSLKDKSAGYPHLVNVEPEPKKQDKEEKKEQKLSQNLPPPPQPPTEDHANTSWPHNQPQAKPFHQAEPPRLNYQHKNYGIQNTGINYNPNYQAANTNVNNQGIRLPVVNPKEIDVRSAALQKQNARSDMMHDANKFGPQFQMSLDKKNFLNDLPPRFANQYRHWQTTQEHQSNAQDNKFRDDSFRAGNNQSSLFNNQQRSNWPVQSEQSFQQQMPWPNNYPNLNFSPNVQPNFYAHLTPNPYQNLPTFTPMSNQNKPEIPSYLQSNIGQLPNLQNFIPPSNFSSPLNNFGGYQPQMSYDSAMYPQFNKLGFQGQVRMEKPPGYLGEGVEGGQSFGTAGAVGDAHRSPGNTSYSEHGKNEALASRDGNSRGAVESCGNTYSLFSGAPPPSAWGPRDPQLHQQSLWSGPGPSALERLLEQQKLMKQPPSDPQPPT